MLACAQYSLYKAVYRNKFQVYKPSLLTTSDQDKTSMSIFSFFLFDWYLCSHSALIIGWWRFNTRTEDIETLDSVPILYLVHYCISHIFGSCLFPPTSLSLPLHSPLPHTLPPPPLRPLITVPPDPTIY